MGDDVQLRLDRGEGRGQPRWGEWEGGGFHSCYGNEIFVLGCQGNFRHTLDTAAVTTAPPPTHNSHDCRESTSHVAHADWHTRTCTRLLQLPVDGLLNFFGLCYGHPLRPPARAEQDVKRVKNTVKRA